jgi:2-C-methyl-D-erythritol 4-phosphate cytidylyltransferase
VSIYALIPAAGRGARFGSLKQYVPIGGRPMLWHAVRAVCMPPVESVFVVLARADREFARHEWNGLGAKVEPLYCGGETRRDSVYNALVAAMGLVEVDDWMLVHDAARPCLPRSDLEKLVREVGDDGVGGILALPIVETVKRVADGKVHATEDRAQLWLAQTPQMFRAGLLVQALERAPSAPTDEASAVEQMGLKPRVIAGSRENLKVTWPEDVAIAESILERRR